MNLVQKLPIGLGLACMMMLSSCSKEDASAPTPEVAGVNESSGLREGGNGIQLLPPALPQTNGLTGIGKFAPGWIKNYMELPAGPQVDPSGTSSLTHLWGDQSLPWMKPLPAVPGTTNTGSVITVLARDSYGLPNASIAKATVKNLKIGKKYVITFYAAGTVQNAPVGQLTPAYPMNVYVAVCEGKSELWAAGGQFGDWCNFEGKQATWVKKEILFTADVDTMSFAFTAKTPQSGQFGYANIFVGENAIKQVN